MRTFSSLKGLPVYLNNSDETVGKVSDLYLSVNGKIIGLLIEGKGLLKRERLVSIDSILSFHDDGIMITDMSSLQPVSHEEGAYFLYKHGDLAGKIVLTSAGNKLGLLDDVYIREEVGTIIGYEVTDGFFADITEGKKVISTNKALHIRKDAIVVDVNSNL